MTVFSREAIVLVAHGSGDPRAALATRGLARAVRAAVPGAEVRVAFLEHAGPRPGAVLRRLQAAGAPGAVVVPLLFTAAYHRRVDLPAVLDEARAEGLRLPVRVSDVLGPVAGVVDPLLLDGLSRRLRECVPTGVDALVLAAAGTRDEAARATVARAATALGARWGVPCVAGFASAAGPDPAGAVAGLRAAGARRVAVAAYFMAPGRLYDLAAAGARAGGAWGVAAPLADAPEVAALIRVRAEATRTAGALSAAA